MNRFKRDTKSQSYSISSPRLEFQPISKSPKLPDIVGTHKLTNKFFISPSESSEENSTKKLTPPLKKNSEILFPPEGRKLSSSQMKSERYLSSSIYQYIFDENEDKKTEALEFSYLNNEISILKEKIKQIVRLT